MTTVQESIAALRVVRRSIMQSAATTPDEINALVERLRADLEACKIVDSPAPSPDPEPAPDKSRTRPKGGGRTRVQVTEPEGTEGE